MTEKEYRVIAACKCQQIVLRNFNVISKGALGSFKVIIKPKSIQLASQAAVVFLTSKQNGHLDIRCKNCGSKLQINGINNNYFATLTKFALKPGNKTPEHEEIEFMGCDCCDRRYNHLFSILKEPTSPIGVISSQKDINLKKLIDDINMEDEVEEETDDDRFMFSGTDVCVVGSYLGHGLSDLL